MLTSLVGCMTLDSDFMESPQHHRALMSPMHFLIRRITNLLLACNKYLMTMHTSSIMCFVGENSHNLGSFINGTSN